MDAKYKDYAYVYDGGNLLAVFAQYGEVVVVNLVRDKATGKSKGFAFIAFEDQRSTNLAVDNLNGAQILRLIMRVDHVTKYKKLEEEDGNEVSVVLFRNESVIVEIATDFFMMNK